LNQLAHRVIDGEVRAIARAISVVENERDGKEALIDTLFPHCGWAAVWGITGAPGAGKSSLADCLIEHLRQLNKRVAVIAVDPSSPFTGGAILGDRLRMQKHSTDDGVFIRSMASRGHLGGLAGATADAIKVLDAAGFDHILVETIGVGQTEIEIVQLSDLVLLVLVPGMGDEIQALKAGVMEIGDLFVINKKDVHGADRLKAAVEYVLGIKSAMQPEQNHPVLMTSATLREGISEMLDAALDYYGELRDSGMLQKKRRERLLMEIRAIVTAKIQHKFTQFMSEHGDVEKLIAEIGINGSGYYHTIAEKIDTFLEEYNES